MLSHVGSNDRIPEFLQQLIGFHSVGRCKGNHSSLPCSAFDVQRSHCLPVEIAAHCFHIVAPFSQFFGELFIQTVRTSAHIAADADFSGLQHMFVGRLAEIQISVVNIILGNPVDEIGNIPVHIHIFSDSGRTDIFIVLFQSQVDDAAGNRISLTAAGFLLAGFSRKGNMIEPVNRILFRRRLVAGGVPDNIRSHRNIKISARKGFFQPPDV